VSEELVSGFRVSHQAIVDIFDRTQLVARSYLQAKPFIREMEAILLVHFNHQDKELFDRLRELFRSDRESEKMIEFLTHDLKDIKIKFLIFFEKHSGEVLDTNWRSFPVDFLQFHREVLARIKVEESYLFPLIVKLPSKAP